MTKFLDEQENQRTKQNTIKHVQLFQEYILATKTDSTKIEDLNPKVLNDYLCSFYLGIRKQSVRIWAELLEKHLTKSGKTFKETKLCKINYRGFRILWIAWDSKGKTNWFKKKGKVMVRKRQIRLMTKRLKFCTKKNNLALLHLTLLSTHYGGNSPPILEWGGTRNIIIYAEAMLFWNVTFKARNT